MLCGDCVQCRQDLDKAGVAYVFCDFAENLLWLKEFLKIRDENALFASVKEAGAIGIPCIVDEEGRILLEWSKYVGQAST